jgi:23S rRNA (cytosine1962-C5)-methyltransferase
MKETIITVKKEFVNKYKKGYPLILEEALEITKDLKEEGQIITLVDEKKVFLGKGYYGSKIRVVAGF